jgi:hypothetical protein
MALTVGGCTPVDVPEACFDREPALAGDHDVTVPMAAATEGTGRHD